uniref:Thioredoxin domain-containing protein n=1 Tax=Romanomermis culicivorax TaxID=13658 RepID=A0A915ID79_ROMCU
MLIAFRYSYSAYVKSLTNEDFEKTIQNTDIVFVNFYADWCRFSQLLSPVFDEAASQFQNNTNVIFGSIDCDNQAEVAQKYQISKYPTLKLFRSGKLAKREYRGQRTAGNLADFVRSQMIESINVSTDATSLAEKIN